MKLLRNNCAFSTNDSVIFTKAEDQAKGKRKVLALVALVVVVFLTSGFSIMAKAADVYSEKYSIYLDGEIRRGDAERVVVAAMEAKIINRITVNSMGGDLMEAMRIAAIVKDAHWGVYVAKGKVCVSACFFIFLAGEPRVASRGVYDDGTLIAQEKRDRWFGSVGIHRPYFKDPLGNPESPKKQEEMMRKVRAYLASEGVAGYLVDVMMSHPSNDVYWLRERDYDLLGEYNPGIEETLIAKCGYKKTMKMVDKNWSDDRIAQVQNCEVEYLSAINFPLRHAYVAKLRTGWRPWSKK